MIIRLKDKSVGDLVWVPAGVRLWQLLDEGKKIPTFKIKTIEKPMYLLVTYVSESHSCRVSYEGEEWSIESKESP